MRIRRPEKPGYNSVGTMKLKHIFHISILISFGVCLFACNGGENGPHASSIEEYLQEGGAYLSQGDHASALNSYQTILDEWDPDNSQATWGAAIATILRDLDLLGGKIDDLIDTLSSFATASLPPHAFRPQQSGLNTIIENSLEDMGLNRIDDILSLLSRIKEDPDFAITMDDFPVDLSIGSFGSSVTFSYNVGGEFDLGEVYFVSALLKIIKSLAFTALSINLSVSSTGLTEIHTLCAPLINGEGKFLTDREVVFASLARIIATSPDFCSIEPNQGAERLRDAADLLMEAMSDLVNLFNIVRAEEDPQADDIIAYDVQGNHRYFTFNYRNADGNPLIIEIEDREEPIDAMGFTLSSLQVAGGAPVNFREGLVPIISTLIYGILQTDLPDIFMEPIVPLLLDLLEPGLVQLISDTVTQIYDYTSSEETIEGVIDMLMQDADILEIDMGKFFRDPPDRFLRSFWPVTVADPVTGYRFLIEFECTDMSREVYWCEYPESVSSTAHFTGTEYEIADDGVDSHLGYIAFQDPALGGILYLNLHPLDPSRFPADVFAEADQFKLNYFIATIINGLFLPIL